MTIHLIQELNQTLSQFQPQQINNTLRLLVEEEHSLPFVSRYRKEQTGNLDEVQIKLIHDTFLELEAREKRRTYILEELKKLEKLTPDLEKKVQAAKTLNELEDIWTPFKSKRKTKAQKAKEAGLEPLARAIAEGRSNLSEIIQDLKLEGKEEDLINESLEILIEEISQNTELKKELRELFQREAICKTSKREEADTQEEASKFEDYFDYSEKYADLLSDKKGHRFLAMRRAQSLKIIKLEIALEPEVAQAFIRKRTYPEASHTHEKLIEKVIKKAYNVYLSSSLDLECKTELKKKADLEAIEVFGTNLKSLLLAPYLGPRPVLGIDPGIRTGCKCVIVDQAGQFMGDFVVFPFQSETKMLEGLAMIQKAIEHFHIEHIAVGNGTQGRETLDWLKTSITDKKIHITMVNEAGASIYSASDVAREEFPKLDVTVRGAISIARRFQDPLAELVKIDPKSIGVGQYQHDVNQSLLKKELQATIEHCVNYVGVDLNTASPHLLSYVSGIGPETAKKITEYRYKNGPFKTRQDLLQVPRFSQKVFTESSGFLRIYNGENPLDATFIHPEQYETLQKWCNKHAIAIETLKSESKWQTQFIQELKSEVGEHTIDDMLNSLKAKTQDPREEFVGVEFRKDIRTIDDIKIGEIYPGVVNNLTHFGAFVDIGIKESGLLHISQMRDHFVQSALDEFKVGDQVKAKVIDVDKKRKRISLSLKEIHQNTNTLKNKAPNKSRSSNQQGPKKNNPFQNLRLN